jgi:hypothetical protein
VRLTRLAYLSLLVVAVASVLQNFPRAPSERAAVICRPVRWFTGAAAVLASSMDDTGHVGPTRQPWHQDLHRACLRVAERLFIAAAEP